MTSTSSRRARRYVGTGLSLALIAGAGAVAAVPLSNALASGHATAVTPAAVAPRAVSTSVQARVVSTPRAVVTPNALLSSPCASASACTLYARTGTTSALQVKSATPITLTTWKFSTEDVAAGGGSAVITGEVGVEMTITLTNNLPVIAGMDQSLSLSMPQLDGKIVGAPVAPGDTGTFTFTPNRAGTFTYQAGIGADGARQIAMGLVGALVVRPSTTGVVSTIPGDAAGKPKGVAYDATEQGYVDEAVLVYTDVDTRLAADPAGFNMRYWSPQYHLLNGLAYPDTQVVSGTPGADLMLRVVNGAALEKSPTILGTRLHVVARGSRPLPAPLDVSGRMMATGDTFDARITMPADPTFGGNPVPTRYALYSTPGELRNGQDINTVSKNAPVLGGALTFIETGAVTPGSLAGPKIASIAVTSQPGVAAGTGLTAHAASFKATLTDAQGVGGAEYFIDQVDPAAVSGNDSTAATELVGAWGGSPATVTWSLSDTQLALLATGQHTLWVRAKNSSGNWGAFGAAHFRVDNTGPTAATVLTDPIVGGVYGPTTTDIQSTLDETTTGGSNVTAARYWVGASSDPADAGNVVGATVVTTNGPRVVAAGDATLDVTALPEGLQKVHVQGKDQYGHWGTESVSTLTVDRTAPAIDLVTLDPKVTDGLVGSLSKPDSVRVTAKLHDVAGAGGVTSAITTVEAYVGATPGDLNSPLGLTMSALPNGDWTGDMPLAWLAGITADGPVSISVAATDAAGNRSATSPATTVLLDRTAPTISGLVASQGTTLPGTRTLTVQATVTDPVAGTSAGSGVGFAEWWIGADPGVGGGTAVTGKPVGAASWSISVTRNLLTSNLTNGAITIGLRVRDVAGNLRTSSINYTIVNVPFFRNNFNSSLSATETAFTNQTAVNGWRGTPALEGNRSLITPVTGTGRNAFRDLTVVGMVSAPSATTLRASFQMAINAGTRTGCTGTGTACTNAPDARSVLVIDGPTGTDLVRVEFGKGTTTGANRFRLVVRRTNGTYTTSAWRTIANAASYTAVVDWTKNTATNARTTVTINGNAITVTGGTANQNATGVYVGLIGNASGTGTHADSGTLRFDRFSLA